MADLARLASQMDRLYEFDREPVTPDKLKSFWRFAGLYAGEHVAATEFVIGAFFVLHGVTAAALIAGLLVGNLLAVLSWTFICAPIATDTRLTLYWYLRRIAGPGLTLLCNVANAILYCVLAGAMISVSATAVGLFFGVRSPALSAVLPPSTGYVVICLALGAAFTTLAILGFDKLSRFNSICSPWLFTVFAAGAIAVMPGLGVQRDLSNLWEVLSTRVWNGVPTPGQEPYGFWHITFFAWFCNLAMHIGLSDMALLRYAKRWTYGVTSAFGMYLGHFLAWLCSGLMVAAIGREMDPGRMAFEAAGWAGALAVLIAGWTTANPTLYRAGLALQAVTPDWQRWKITLVAGIVTTILACFPVFFLKLLDYVAIYGLVLMPIGAIVFAEHWMFPRLGLQPYRAATIGRIFNWQALIVWVGTLVFCALLPIHLFYRWLPGYVLALVAYPALARLSQGSGPPSPRLRRGHADARPGTGRAKADEASS